MRSMNLVVAARLSTLVREASPPLLNPAHGTCPACSRAAYYSTEVRSAPYGKVEKRTHCLALSLNTNSLPFAFGFGVMKTQLDHSVDAAIPSIRKITLQSQWLENPNIDFCSRLSVPLCAVPCQQTNASLGAVTTRREILVPAKCFKNTPIIDRLSK
jgi:hypothetical protein